MGHNRTFGGGVSSGMISNLNRRVDSPV